MADQIEMKFGTRLKMEYFAAINNNAKTGERVDDSNLGTILISSMLPLPMTKQMILRFILFEIDLTLTNFVFGIIDYSVEIDQIYPEEVNDDSETGSTFYTEVSLVDSIFCSSHDFENSQGA